MKTHYLKINADEFQSIFDGLQTSDLRQNDRDFQVGDIVVLQETVYSALDMIHGSPLEYTGREQTVTVTHIIDGNDWHALPNDWCVLSFKHNDNRCRHVGGSESLAASQKISELQAEITALEYRLNDSGVITQ